MMNNLRGNLLFAASLLVFGLVGHFVIGPWLEPIIAMTLQQGNSE